MKSYHESGFGMIEAIFAATIGIIGLFYLATGITSMKKASRNVDSGLELAGVRKNLIESVDCAATFAGRTKGNPCPTGTYLTLKKRAGTDIIDANGTRSGRWVIRAYCQSSASPGGLDVRALGILPAHDSVASAKNWLSGSPNPLHYRKDELTSAPYDWNHPKARMFSPGGAGALCGSWFGTSVATPGCNAGQYVKNVDFETQTVTCANLPSCPVGQMLRGYFANGQPDCRVSGDRIIAHVECLICENGNVCGHRNESGGAWCNNGAPVCPGGSYAVNRGYYHDDLSSSEPCDSTCGGMGTHVGYHDCLLSD
jgi:hypothetical protein